MKKYLSSALLLLLLLVISVFLASCQMEDDKLDESPKERSEATGEILSESVFQSKILTPNQEYLESLDSAFEDIVALLDSENPDITIEASLKAKDGKAFSFATTKDYEKLKAKYEASSLPDSSLLVPSSYKEICIKITPESSGSGSSSDGLGLTLSYTLSDDTKDSFSNSDDDYETDTLYWDACALFCGLEAEDNDTTSQEKLLAILSKISPKVEGEIVLNNKYTLKFSENLTISENNVLLLNDVYLLNGASKIATFKCKLSIKLFDDFNIFLQADEDAGTITTKPVGRASLSISDFELTFGTTSKNSLSLDVDLKMEADFSKKEISAELNLNEVIAGKQIISLEAAMDLSESDINNADNVAKLIGKLKIYTLKIGGTSYSADSAKTLLLSLLESQDK